MVFEGKHFGSNADSATHLVKVLLSEVFEHLSTLRPDTASGCDFSLLSASTPAAERKFSRYGHASAYLGRHVDHDHAVGRNLSWDEVDSHHVSTPNSDSFFNNLYS